MQAASVSIEATTSDMKAIQNDNMDNRSVCSSVASSMRNAELILAAFSNATGNNNNPLALTIEEEDEEGDEMDLEQMGKSNEVSSSQASSGEFVDTSGLNNNSNEFTSFENEKNDSNSDDNILVSDSDVSEPASNEKSQNKQFQVLTDVPIVSAILYFGLWKMCRWAPFFASDYSVSLLFKKNDEDFRNYFKNEMKDIKKSLVK